MLVQVTLWAGRLWLCCICHSVAAACQYMKASLTLSRQLQSPFCSFWVEISVAQGLYSDLVFDLCPNISIHMPHSLHTILFIKKSTLPFLATVQLFLPLQKALCFGLEDQLFFSGEACMLLPYAGICYRQRVSPLQPPGLVQTLADVAGLVLWHGRRSLKSHLLKWAGRCC